MPRTRDLTTGPIARTLIVFALPTLASNVLQSLNGSVNSIWVGKFIGEGALAATSNANIVMFLMFGLVFGFGMAATILVGQSFGRHDLDGARRAFGSAVGLVLLGACIIGFVGWATSGAILRLLDTPGEAQGLAEEYLRVTFLGMPPSMLLVLLMMGLRGSGDSLTPLWFMGLSVLLDGALNPVLIAGLGPAPRLGIAGSATATLIVNTLSCAALLAYIYARDLPIRLRGAEWRYLLPEPALMRVVLAKGLPMGAQMLVMSTAGLSMIGLVNKLGVDTAAAYGVSQNLWTYLQMPALAIGAAVSAMAAQNIGAGRWERVGRITRSGVLLNLLLTGVMIAAMLAFDRPVMRLFNLGAEALLIARHIQLVASWTFILFGVTIVIFSTVRANGATIPPLLILIVSLYPVRLGFATLLRPALGPDAIWLSFPIGSLVSMALALAYYRLGRWRTEMLVVPEEAREQTHAQSEPVGRAHPTG
ncbi:MATE family efflux transporter [Sphingomonas aracearum]|uniref:MATE family efflux transporter n=1 Tax=Sphingomonas aracearum TaxID=2283317 RepID=A0A369VVK9_9SPHN|nr:MATE family efflux transporter [Sphingomonas aracearum]RDE05210.1 MATE family efflux transporter [Sphingomonas aracearum]